MKVCIIVSNFYPEISKMLLKGASKKLVNKNLTSLKIVKVPGCFEIPVVISNLANKYDGFVALGCVIKGQTPHFDFLCTSIFNALTILNIEKKIPIGNGILTCNNKKQAIKRSDPRKIDKGGSAAQALLSLLQIIKK